MSNKNFAYSTVLTAPSPATSGTSLVVQSSDGAKFSVDSFRATVWPAGEQPTSANAEIVTVSSISTDTFTIIRAQESTSARTIVVGDQIAMTETANTLNFPGLIYPYAARVAPLGFLSCDGSTISRTTYAPLFAAIAPSLSTVTITNATPAVVTNTAHGLSTGDSIYLTTTGTLPTGLSPNTLYYVVRIDANSYNLSSTRANAYAATKLATSGAGSGTHTAWDCPFGLGDGSTTFTLPDFRGRTIAGLDTTGGTAAGRLSLADPLGTYGNIGAAGGEQRHTMVTAEMVSHNHSLPNGGTGNSPNNPGNFFNAQYTNGSAGATGSATGTGSAGSTTPFNLISPTALANYIIKT